MPSSYVDSIPPIINYLIATQPRRVIDVGPGWGKYGLMCREYLPDLEKLWAIEVPEGHLWTQNAIYDEILERDVRVFSEPGYPWTEADLVLLIDVIEHMPEPDGHRLLHAILRSGTKVLVATPKLFIEQHDDHNPYETHLSLWSWPTFQPHGIAKDLSTIDAVIYVLEGS